MSESDKQGEEARRILRRVETDNASFLTGSIETARDKASAHFTARDAQSADKATLWASRIGRLLGLVFFVVLVINLFTGWFF